MSALTFMFLTNKTESNW